MPTHKYFFPVIFRLFLSTTPHPPPPQKKMTGNKQGNFVLFFKFFKKLKSNYFLLFSGFFCHYPPPPPHLMTEFNEIIFFTLFLTCMFISFIPCFSQVIFCHLIPTPHFSLQRVKFDLKNKRKKI